MKNILIPVDFSVSSENALKYAVLLTGKLKAKIFLYHSFYSPHASGHLSVDDADMGKKTGKEIALHNLINLYNLCLPADNQEVEYICSAIELREELPRLITEKNIDLVVMGTNGIGRLAGKFFGTNTSWTIENISCPVIAIPEFSVPQQICNITYASEYLDSDIANLKKLAVIAKAFGAVITIAHVISSNSNKEAALLTNFKSKLEKEEDLAGIKIRTIVSADVEEALEEHMKQEAVDLMVMSAQQRDLYDKLFGKSITRIMVHHLLGPAMFFHHRK